MTKRRSIVVAGALLLLIATACKTNQTSSTSNSNSAAPSTPDEFAQVRQIYDKNCSNCHNKDGEGGTAKAEDGSKLKVPSLREGRALRHEDAEYLSQIIK